MVQWMNEVLVGFRPCFSRKAAFEWFVVIVVGLLVRTDFLGATSVIRSLMLTADYLGLIGFFRSSAWNLEALTGKWCELVRQNAPLVRQGDAVVIVGDGVKEAKEGRRMPGVKRLHQESGNSSKPDYIWGHLFGGVGILAEKDGKRFCLPLALTLQDGVKTIFGWGGGAERQGSHVTEMLALAGRVASRFGRAILLLDRYFLSVPALLAMDGRNAGTDAPPMQIVTKAKRNCVAYRLPENVPGRRGRPRKKGDSVKLLGLFASEPGRFSIAEAALYGKREVIRYRCLDLLWGQGLYRMLRFVLVEYGGSQTILVSTDLSLAPLDIVHLYGRRFGVEVMFREMKQVVCAFGYRFWSKYMPKINRFRKKSDPDPLEMVVDPHAQARIALAVKATEGFLFCSAVAMGLLQMTSLRFSGTGELANLRYLRTYRGAVPSEATVADYIRKNFFRLLLRHPDLPMAKIIASKQGGPIGAADDSGAA